MFNRISAFVKVIIFIEYCDGRLTIEIIARKTSHEKRKTQETLQSHFTEAKTIGAKTKLKTARTEKGIKDTVQEFFLKKLFTSYKGKNGPKAKQDALDAAVADLPSDITSPVWQLQGTLLFITQDLF